MNIKCILVSEGETHETLVFYKAQDIWKVLMKNDKRILFDCKCCTSVSDNLIENFKLGNKRYNTNNNKIVMNRWTIHHKSNSSADYILPIIEKDGMVTLLVQYENKRYVFKSSINKFNKLIYNL